MRIRRQLMEGRIVRHLTRYSRSRQATADERKQIGLLLDNDEAFEQLVDRIKEHSDENYDGPKFGDMPEGAIEEPVSHPFLSFLWDHRVQIMQWVVSIVMTLMLGGMGS